MFSKMSLIFSRIQKEILEDGEVKVSDVLDSFNKIKETTLANDTKTCNIMQNGKDDLTQATAKEYMSDMKCQNLIDPWGLFKKLKLFLKPEDPSNTHAAVEVIRKTNVLMLLPDNFMDPKMADLQVAKLLFSENTHTLYKVNIEHASSPKTENEFQAAPLFNLFKCTWGDIEDGLHSKLKSRSLKRGEKYSLHLFLGYLNLLLNSRDELSLAKVICGAGGILNHDAFDTLKKESLKTKMPMYQV